MSDARARAVPPGTREAAQLLTGESQKDRPMSALTHFAEQPETRAYAAGDVVFREGDESDGRMYVLIEGAVRASREGRELETLAAAGDVFGEIGLIDRLPRSATVHAEQATRVVVVDEQSFRLLILRNPTFALEIMRMLTRRARANLL